MKNITKGFIKKIDDNSFLGLQIPLKNLEKHENILIIMLEAENFTKITMYPINSEKVLKLSLRDFKIIQEDLDNFSKKLQSYPIIHSSGLINIGPNSAFECYINLSLEDEKYQDLKILLDKNKNKFKDIKIEELSFEDNQ